MTDVVAALIERDGKILICRRPAHKARPLMWEFPGGKVEPGEKKAQALIRECREELDVTVHVTDTFMTVTHAYPDLTVRLTVMHANIMSGTLTRLEHEDIRWIAIEDIPNYDFCPADREILQALQAGKHAIKKPGS